MSSGEMEQAGLPSSFSSTKVTKKTEKNRKKKAQKKNRNNLKKDDTRANNEIADHFNYAEEFKIKEILTEYKNPFTILMPKSERFKTESDYESECDEDEEHEKENENESYELDYGFDTEPTELETVSSKENNTIASPSKSKSAPSSDSDPLYKYYHQRYDYFSRFDEGIQIDHEGWYSVTPEIIADHIAKEAHAIAFTNKKDASAKTVILDAFCGVGGNTIQFARYFDEVIAVDLDEGRLEMARHNASIYGLADKIKFVHGDVFKVLPDLVDEKGTVDLVFMSPPWGGPDYVNRPIFCPRADLLDSRGQDLFALGRAISKNLILFLPRQSDIFSVAKMYKDEESTTLKKEDSFVVEQHWLRNRLKAISIYFY